MQHASDHPSLDAPAGHTALISLKGVCRAFPFGDATVAVLRDITLSIDDGEMVAIVGPSGSGKSTLMNIIGGLDRPTSGDYQIGGRSVAGLEPDELAALRRDHFGFVFQRYNLLSELSALGNAEMPALYAGVSPSERRLQAERLLARLGMADRLQFRPGRLSGGQQQRVSIARALVNDAGVILADEPTGSLDTRSGEAVLQILTDLHRQGRTIILVTHDMAIARRADRIIEIADGAIVSDRRTDLAKQTVSSDAVCDLENANDRKAAALPRSGWRVELDRFHEAFTMALVSLNAHKLRTALTMLGIIIGIASVVMVVALGEGARLQVLTEISGLGTNTLDVLPGHDFGDLRSNKVRTLVLSDADELARQPFVAGVTPMVSVNRTLRIGATEVNALINGVGVDYFLVKGAKLASGRIFSSDSVHQLAPEVVIDDNTRSALFADTSIDPVGQIIQIGDVPATIIGVLQKQVSGFGGTSMLSVYLPYSTVQARLTGSDALRSLVLRVAEDIDTTLAEQATITFLTARHGVQDFFVMNNDDIRQAIAATTQTLTLLVAAIALISLIVGGIGVMNIMLVSVSERVTEIGVRMAVGARGSDILQQFLTEAVLVCLVGGILGVALALIVGEIAANLGAHFRFVYSLSSILAAFGVSTLIGLVFGYLPARSAALLDPAVALSRE